MEKAEQEQTRVPASQVCGSVAPTWQPADPGPMAPGLGSSSLPGTLCWKGHRPGRWASHHWESFEQAQLTWKNRCLVFRTEVSVRTHTNSLRKAGVIRTAHCRTPNAFVLKMMLVLAAIYGAGCSPLRTQGTPYTIRRHSRA